MNYTGLSEDALRDIANWILKAGKNIPPVTDITIHFAAYKGYLVFVKKLLDDGVNVDSEDFLNLNETPLMKAAKQGHLEVVKLLIENKADFERKNEGKVNALFMACKSGHLEIVQRLIEIGSNIHCECTFDKITPLTAASEFGHSKVAELLLQNGADVNCLEFHKVTPLYRASENGHVETAKLLIKHGADINFQGRKDRHTALHIATQKGHYEVVKLLLKHGAKVDCLLEGGWTPLLLAIATEQTRVRMIK